MFSRRQVLLLGEYAEVVDAIPSRPPGCNSEDQRQSRVWLAERTTEESTNNAEEGPALVLPPLPVRERLRYTKPPPLQLQLPQQSLIQRKAAEFRARSEVVTANPLKAGRAFALISDRRESGKIDHVYDSVDAVTSPNTTPEAVKVLGAQQGGNSSKAPPIYHVLEGPTPVPDSGDEPGTPAPVNPQPTVPPKPPRSRERIQSCASLDSEISTQSQVKFIQKQLSSVMEFYQGVQDRERSVSSVALPPRAVRGEVRDSDTPQRDFKEHVYHTLEDSSTAKNMPQFSGKGQQHKEKTVKANSANISKMHYQEKAEESTVYKTKEHDFQSEVPKIPQQISSKMAKENKHPKQLSQKPEEGECYAQPYTRHRKPSAECRLFDDPAYCTQSCSGSQKLDSSTDSAIESPNFDDPSYATPSGPKSRQDVNQSADSLFDDPKYHSPATKPDSPTSRSLRVRFDDPKYNPTQGRNVLHKRLLERERKGVRHSSSVDHFSPSIYSGGTEFLDHCEDKVRGNSLTNLTEQVGDCRVRGLKATNV